jgi:hypothetical protein
VGRPFPENAPEAKMPMRICPGATARFLVTIGCLGVFPSLTMAAPAPGSQNDCAATSKALYGRAEFLSKRTKQIIPREFVRVWADLDDSCDAGDFEKARISIDWMNTCLKNFTKNYKLGFCSRNKTYFCAVYPKSDGCRQGR